MNKEILIHVGYQKTGTTWLQKQIFSQPNTGFYMPFDRQEIKKFLIEPFPLDFNKEESKPYFSEKYTQRVKKNLFPVLSMEQLSGSMYLGGYDSCEVARRIQKVFGQAKILIVIREQASIILSTYGQYIKMGGTSSLKRYLNAQTNSRSGVRGFDLYRYQYHKLIKYYYQLFGRERVLVLPYESFTKDSRKYCSQIQQFCKIYKELPALDESKQNPSWPMAGIRFMSYSNLLIGSQNRQFTTDPFFLSQRKIFRFYKNQVHKIFNSFSPKRINKNSKKRKLEMIRQTIKDFYKESNQQTTILTGLPLQEYGYEL